MTNTKFKKSLWAAVNKLRGPVGAATYKYSVLGLACLKYFRAVFVAQGEVIAGRLVGPHCDLAEEEACHEVLADFAETSNHMQ